MKNLFLAALVVLAIFYLVGLSGKKIENQIDAKVESQMQNIKAKVAQDADMQLASAVSTGDRSQICLYLGLAAAAHNQAHNDERHKELVKQQKRICP